MNPFCFTPPHNACPLGVLCVKGGGLWHCLCYRMLFTLKSYFDMSFGFVVKSCVRFDAISIGE